MDDPTIGTILVNEVQLWGCVIAALMSMFLVNRHTRLEEDVERADVLRSTVVGRHAPATAAMVVVAGAQIAVAAACALGFVLLDYEVAGSVALALSFLAVGLVFIGVAAVAAQVAGSSRASLGIAGAVLGTSFVLRAVGDVGDNGVRWLSPIGWAQAVRAFAGEAFWTIGLCVAVAVGLVVASYTLSTRRDLGSGLRPERLGRPSAPRWMRSPVGLAWRLQRGLLAGWAVAMFLFGVVYGSIADDVESLVEDNEAFADLLAQLQGVDLVDSFLATSVNMLGLFATGYAIAGALRIRTEELAGRAEPVLAGPIARSRWAMGHLAVGAAGAAIVLGAAGLGLGSAYAAVVGDWTQVPRLVGSALAVVPAVLVVTGATVGLLGLLPRAALAAWALLALIVVVGMFGDLLRLPEWTADLAPLSHVPAVPAVGLDPIPLVVLVAVAAALTAAGLGGLRRRDLRL